MSTNFVAPAGVVPEDPAPAFADESFSELVRRFLPDLVRFARRLTDADEVDDLVQDTLQRAWLKQDSYSVDRGTFRAWIFAIAADRARYHYRREARRRRIMQFRSDGTIPERDLAASYDLDRAVRSLPPRQRLAVFCFYYAELSIEESAFVMRCSSGTVKSTLSDARTALRRKLGDRDEN